MFSLAHVGKYSHLQCAQWIPNSVWQYWDVVLSYQTSTRQKFLSDVWWHIYTVWGGGEPLKGHKSVNACKMSSLTLLYFKPASSQTMWRDTSCVNNLYHLRPGGNVSAHGLLWTWQQQRWPAYINSPSFSFQPGEQHPTASSELSPPLFFYLLMLLSRVQYVTMFTKMTKPLNQLFRRLYSILSGRLYTSSLTNK